MTLYSCMDEGVSLKWTGASVLIVPEFCHVMV